MNDQVNKVIAAILSSDQGFEGGAKRSKKRRSKSHEHGVAMYTQRLMRQKLHGGSTETIEGGSCGAMNLATNDSIRAGRYVFGGSVVAPVETTSNEAPTLSVSFEGGKKKRKLPPALRKQNKYTMSRYSQIKRMHPDWPHNEVLAESMKSGGRSKLLRKRSH